VVNGPRRRGFTLLEMMITLAIFVLLAAAVFGIMTGTLQSTGILQDNQNRSDQVDALDAFLKKKLCEMPPAGQMASYRRGDGEGLIQNGIVLGTANTATAIDAKVQANGYYTLRLVTYSSVEVNGAIPDARQTLVQLVMSDDPSLVWTPLITDIKTLDWKFLDFNLDLTQWADLWNNTSKPNLVEFSLQLGGDLQPTTMDFWVPKVDPITLNHTVPTPNAP
jgi:prepilin-type N-terminal cleavage/methylation domain-containing protein